MNEMLTDSESELWAEARQFAECLKPGYEVVCLYPVHESAYMTNKEPSHHVYCECGAIVDAEVVTDMLSPATARQFVVICASCDACRMTNLVASPRKE